MSRRQRVPRGDVGGEVQRARTDWQKRDDNTWVKVVPPWWAEHKTVHFASKWGLDVVRSWVQGWGTIGRDSAFGQLSIRRGAFHLLLATQLPLPAF